MRLHRVIRVLPPPFPSHPPHLGRKAGRPRTCEAARRRSTHERAEGLFSQARPALAEPARYAGLVSRYGRRLL